MQVAGLLGKGICQAGSFPQLPSKHRLPEASSQMRPQRSPVTVSCLYNDPHPTHCPQQLGIRAAGEGYSGKITRGWEQSRAGLGDRDGDHLVPRRSRGARGSSPSSTGWAGFLLGPVPGLEGWSPHSPPRPIPWAVAPRGQTPQGLVQIPGDFLSSPRAEPAVCSLIWASCAISARLPAGTRNCPGVVWDFAR